MSAVERARVVLQPDEILMPGQAPTQRAESRAPAVRPASTLARYTLHDSPLWTGEHSLWGRIVTDPREVAAIAARVYSRRRRSR